LISLGHKKIGHVSGFQSQTNGRERLQGYKEALEQSGIPVNQNLISEGECDFSVVSRAALHLLDQGVTALFVGNDMMAYAVLKAIQNKGLRIPEDVAIVGMDDLEMSAWVHPSLTSVSYDIEAFASVAAKYVINKIQSPLIKPDLLKDRPKPNLVIRSSCGAKSQPKK